MKTSFLVVVSFVGLVLTPVPSLAKNSFAFSLWGSLAPPSGWEIYSGEFVGDAAPDIAAYHPPTGGIWVAENTGASFSNFAQWFTTSPASGWVATAGEFTGDTLSDIVLYHPSTTAIFVLRNTGSGFVEENWGTTNRSGVTDLWAADYDGDGLIDVSFYSPTSGELAVGLNNGGSFSYSAWFVTYPASGWVFSSGDFDGDGRGDLAGAHPSTNQVWLGRSTDSAFTFSDTTKPLAYGASASAARLVSGRFHHPSGNRDDLVVYDSATGHVSAGLKTDRGFIHPDLVWATVAPAAGWSMVPGDFDNDGRLDLAAYHGPTGGIWVGRQTYDQEPNRYYSSLPSNPNSPAGYAWPLSAAPGESIEFMISGGNGGVEFFRYRSTDHEVAEVSMGAAVFHPINQPNPAWLAAESGSFGFGWAPSFSITIPANWPSGIYSARIRSGAPGFRDSDATFIVKPTANASPKVAVLANVNTWNAYSNFDVNKYAYGLRGSFQRPMETSWPNPELPIVGQHLMRGELWMLTWLENEGHAPHVFTDIDFHRGEIGTAYDILVLDTHPEYWSREMMDRLDDHLNAGGSLLYMGGNGLFERVEFERGESNLLFWEGVRTSAATAAVDRAEAMLRVHPGYEERARLGVATELCQPVTETGWPFTVLAGSHPLFAGANVAYPDTFGSRSYNTHGTEPVSDPTNGQAAAWETDTFSGVGALGVPSGCGISGDQLQPPPPFDASPGVPVEILASAFDSPLGPSRADITYYDHPGGGKVLSIGSLTATGSLPIDPVLQQLTRNFLPEPNADTTTMAMGLLFLLWVQRSSHRREAS